MQVQCSLSLSLWFGFFGAPLVFMLHWQLTKCWLPPGLFLKPTNACNPTWLWLCYLRVQGPLKPGIHITVSKPWSLLHNQCSRNVWVQSVQLPDSCWEYPSCFGGTSLSAWRTWLLGTAGSVYHWTENKGKSREGTQIQGEDQKTHVKTWRVYASTTALL